MTFGPIVMAASPLFAVRSKAEHLGGPGRGGAGQQFVAGCKMFVEECNPFGCPYRSTDHADDSAAFHIGLCIGTEQWFVFHRNDLAYDLLLQHGSPPSPSAESRLDQARQRFTQLLLPGHLLAGPQPSN